MGLESATEIQQLVPANPLATDPLNQGDDHVRMIKTCLQTSLPGMTAPWTTTSEIKAADATTPDSLVNLRTLTLITDRLGWPFMWLLDALPVVPGAEYLDLAGQALDRVLYDRLFALYGVTYGSGNGTTTFNLPDARGLFLRVQDQGALIDPDALTRTNRGDGQTGDKVGTKQQDIFKAHTHPTPQNAGMTGGSVQITGTGNPINTTGSTGGAETRPKNLYIRMIIRAK
jgi:hypothetical protein